MHAMAKARTGVAASVPSSPRHPRAATPSRNRSCRVRVQELRFNAVNHHLRVFREWSERWPRLKARLGQLCGLLNGTCESPQNVVQAMRVLGFAFPDDQHGKSSRHEGILRPPVPSLVASEFCDPELPIVLWRRGVWTSMVAMPVAAVRKDRPPPGTVGEIGRARQVSILRSISQTEIGTNSPDS